MTFSLNTLKKTLLHPLFLIFLVALLLRLYLLGTFPAGFHIDEVKIGWNGLSILKTGQDDWGKAFPMYYNSFGDFRPTGYFYTVIPSLILFGQNEFGVRFPSALFGALTVFAIYFLTKEIIEGEIGRKIALFTAFLLAVSVWDVSLSRATSEGIIGMFFSLVGLIFFIKLIKQKKLNYLFLCLPFLTLPYFYYHTPRLLTPIMLVVTWAYYTKPWQYKKIFKNSLAILVIILISLTTVVFGLSKEARGRFSQVSIFNDLNIRHNLDLFPFEEGHNDVLMARIFHNKLVLWTQEGINEYTQYFSAKFFLTPFEAKPARYDTVGMGVLSYVELFLLLSGLVAIIRGKYSLLPVLLLLAAPLPAALTTEDSPNQMRALYMIPFIVMIGAVGLEYLASVLPKRRLVLGSIITVLLLNFLFFEHLYFIHNPQRPPIPGDRNVGAKEAALNILLLQNQYDKIIVTNIPDSLYPWYAYFSGVDPKSFNEIAMNRGEKAWQYKNIYFSSVRCPSRDAFTRNNDNVLAIDAEGCEGEAKYSPAIQVLGRIERGDKAYPYIFWHRVEKEEFLPESTPSSQLK
jgi:4-amino-4-deoxy-L-arabinose transferase-like glycosyltransferase